MTKTSILLISLMAALAVPSLAQPAVKVGTFNKQAVVVAWYNSAEWRATLKAKRSEQDAAKKAGDNEKVEQLEKWGRSTQDLAHRQLAGEAPIDEIVKALEPGFPAIAAAAGVMVIAADLSYAGAGVERVDVTANILDWLKSDEATRKLVRSLPANPQKHVH